MAVAYAKCVECGGLARPVTGSVIYPHRPDLHKLTFYQCACGAYCGSHKTNGRPLGAPAGKGTRAARQRAHRTFDPIWKERHMSRGAAYDWLASCLGIATLNCHIALMDYETAERVTRLAKTKLEECRREARKAAAE